MSALQNHTSTESENELRSQLVKLQEAVDSWRQKVQQLKHAFRVYELSMEKVRLEDETRRKELDALHSDLVARERKFNEERRDFKDERERFYKTRELQ